MPENKNLPVYHVVRFIFGNKNNQVIDYKNGFNGLKSKAHTFLLLNHQNNLKLSIIPTSDLNTDNQDSRQTFITFAQTNSRLTHFVAPMLHLSKKKRARP